MLFLCETARVFPIYDWYGVFIPPHLVNTSEQNVQFSNLHSKTIKQRKKQQLFSHHS